MQVFLLRQQKQDAVQYAEFSRSLLHEGTGKFRQAVPRVSFRRLGKQGHAVPEPDDIIAVDSGYAVILLFLRGGGYAGMSLYDISHDTDKSAVLRIRFHPLRFFPVRGDMDV